MVLRLMIDWFSSPGMSEGKCAKALRPICTVGCGFVACLAFLVTPSEPANAADQSFITIGTGGVTGVYYPTGAATCAVINASRADHGVRCSAESTLGSISNMEKIRSGELEFSFVQSDWQKHAYDGTAVFQEAGPFRELRSVFSLHSEVATIVVREGSDFRDIDDLKGKRVNVGGAGSGSAASWNALGNFLGWTSQDQQQFGNLEPSELADALCADRIDAYFVLIGHPARLIEETQEQCDIRLLGFDQVAVSALAAAMPSFTAAGIAEGLYGLPEATPSFGVFASLVTSSKMPDRIVYTVVKSVHENFDDLTGLHAALSNLKAADLVKRDKSVPLHPGALKFFQEQGLVAGE